MARAEGLLMVPKRKSRLKAKPEYVFSRGVALIGSTNTKGDKTRQESSSLCRRNR